MTRLSSKILIPLLVCVLFISTGMSITSISSGTGNCSASVTINLNADKYVNPYDSMTPPPSILAVEINNSALPVFAVQYTCDGKNQKTELYGQGITLSVDPNSSVIIAGIDNVGNYPPPGAGYHDKAILGSLVLRANTQNVSVTAPSSGSETFVFTYYETLRNGAAYIVVGNGGGYSAPLFTYLSPTNTSGSTDKHVEVKVTLGLLNYSNLALGATLFRMLNANWAVSHYLPGSNTTICWITPIYRGTSVYQIPTYFNYTEETGSPCKKA